MPQSQSFCGAFKHTNMSCQLYIIINHPRSCLDGFMLLLLQEAALSERRLSAQEVRLHAQELAQQRAEQAAREAAERRDIIAQLRGLEKAAKAQQKQQGKLFDATAVSEYGMNNQMSLAELRARLTAAKQRQLEEVRPGVFCFCHHRAKIVSEQ